MGVCAYCKAEGKMTREHLVPNWYIKGQDFSEEKSFFLEKAPGKFLRSAPVVKDVCGECNNVKLGMLDDYAKTLYFDEFFDDVFHGEKKSVRFDYELLLRWLMKVSYNSARIHGSNPEVLAAYSRQMLGEEELSTDLMVFMMAVSPTACSGGELGLARRNESGEKVEPRWFRFGAFGIEGSSWFNWIFRHVLINGYCFFLAIPKVGTDFAQECEKVKADLREKGYGTLLEPTGSTLFEPNQHAVGFFVGHMGNYPVAYGIPQSNHVRDVVESNYDLLNFQIVREDVEIGNISPYVASLDSLFATRESFVKCVGQVEFSVDGYNEDSRELWEIPEVREFLRNLDSARPYWAILQSRHGKWLQCLLMCLMTVEKTDNGIKLVRPLELNELMTRWFESLNKFSNRYSLSDSKNKELTFRVRDLIMSLKIE